MRNVFNIVFVACVATVFNLHPAIAQGWNPIDACPEGPNQATCLTDLFASLNRASAQAAAKEAQNERLLEEARKEAEAARKEVEALKTEAAKPTLTPTPAPAPVAEVDATQSTRSVRYVDPRTLDHIGYVGRRPSHPNPLASPLRWAEAGNCLTVVNRKTDPVTGGVFLRVAGVTKVIDQNGVVVSGEVYLAPGDDYSFCDPSGGDSPRMHITTTRVVTSGGESIYDHLTRRMTSVIRGSSYVVQEPFGRDREIGIW